MQLQALFEGLLAPCTQSPRRYTGLPAITRLHMKLGSGIVNESVAHASPGNSTGVDRIKDLDGFKRLQGTFSFGPGLQCCQQEVNWALCRFVD